MFERNRGVRPPSTEQKRGKPYEVTRAMPCKFFAVQYYDGRGVQREEVVIAWAGTYWLTPSGTEWMEALKRAPERLVSGIETVRDSVGDFAPVDDDVEVIDR